MFYVQYLSSLCKRRRWPDPLYLPIPLSNGYYGCNVRVNGREYSIEHAKPTQDLAREAAAMQAYLICRNLSAAEHAAELQRKEQEEREMRERERMMLPGVYGGDQWAPVGQLGVTGGGYMARRGS